MMRAGDTGPVHGCQVRRRPFGLGAHGAQRLQLIGAACGVGKPVLAEDGHDVRPRESLHASEHLACCRWWWPATTLCHIAPNSASAPSQSAALQRARLQRVRSLLLTTPRRFALLRRMPRKTPPADEALSILLRGACLHCLRGAVQADGFAAGGVRYRVRARTWPSEISRVVGSPAQAALEVLDAEQSTAGGTTQPSEPLLADTTRRCTRGRRAGAHRCQQRPWRGHIHAGERCGHHRCNWPATVMREATWTGQVGGRGQTAKSLKHLRTRSQFDSRTFGHKMQFF